MTDTVADNVLVSPPAAPTGAANSMIVRVAKEAGVSPLKQMVELMGLRSARNGITSQEYHEFQVYRPELSKAEKKEFVGEQGSFRLNLRLAPPLISHMRNFLSDKVAYPALLTQLGVRTTETQAFFSPHRYLGNIRTLKSEADVLAFLRDEARYPLFGKPESGYEAKGTVGLDSVDADAGTVRLFSGEWVSLERLVHDIATEYRDGYAFQTAVRQHPEITGIVGRAVSTIRVVTVNEDENPRILYAVWKIPSPTAMSDNFWQSGSMIGLLDPANGEVLTCRRGTGPDSEWLSDHPVSGKPIVGYHLPEWQSVAGLATAAHAMFPINGVLGWDIAICPDGALVIECNPNTGHMLHQLASGRGVLNADFIPVFDRVIARNKRMQAAFDAAQKKRKGKAA